MRSLGLHATPDDLQEMMTEADEDGSGKEISSELDSLFKIQEVLSLRSFSI